MTAAFLTVDTNEANGTLYWVVTQTDDQPNAFQVEAGVGADSEPADLAGSQAVTTTGTQEVTTEESPGLGQATGSPAEPMYWAHFMHKDAAGNRSAVVTSPMFTVGDEFADFAGGGGTNTTLSDDDLGVAPTAGGVAVAFCPAYKSSGKWYFEVEHTDFGVNGEAVGIVPEGAALAQVTATFPWNCAQTVGSGGFSTGGAGDTASLGIIDPGEFVCYAVDLDNWLIWARHDNGNWNNNASADPATGAGGFDISYYVATRLGPHATFLTGSFAGGAKWLFNFGASAFAYAKPSGFDGWTAIVEDAAGHGAQTSITTQLSTNANIEGGGLMVTKQTGGTDVCHVGTSDFRNSGKYYFEFDVNYAGNSDCVGVMTDDATLTNIMTDATNCAKVLLGVGTIFSNDANTGLSIGAVTDGDVVGVAVDLDNNKVWFRKGAAGNWNGQVIGSQNPATNTGGASISSYSAKTLGPMLGFTAFNSQRFIYNSNGHSGVNPFIGTPPSGFTSGWPHN